METVEEQFSRIIAFIEEEEAIDRELNRLRVELGITLVPQLN